MAGTCEIKCLDTSSYAAARARSLTRRRSRAGDSSVKYQPGIAYVTNHPGPEAIPYTDVRHFRRLAPYVHAR